MSINLNGRELDSVTECESLHEVRAYIRNQLHDVSDSVFSFNGQTEIDFVSVFTVAQFLYSCVPVSVLKDLGINELSEQLARDYHISPDSDQSGVMR